MTFGPRKLRALVAAVLALAALILVAIVVGHDAALLFLGALQIITLGAVAAAFVELDRRRRRSDARLDRQVRRAAMERWDELQADLREELAEHRARLRAELLEDQAPPPTFEEVTKHVAAESDQLRKSVHRVEERLARRGAADFAQLEALLGLYAEVRPVRALPATRGWAASPDLLMTCWALAVGHRPSVILECGSGVSTVLFAYACQRNRHGRVVALDHDEGYAQRTRELLADHGLDRWGEVRTAPLEPLAGEDRTWYRLSEVPDERIDLVLVDGPPAGHQPEARAPALEILYSRLSADAVIVVDDFNRAGEHDVVAGWLERYPELSLEKRQHEKGTALLWRRPVEAVLETG